LLQQIKNLLRNDDFLVGDTNKIDMLNSIRNLLQFNSLQSGFSQLPLYTNTFIDKILNQVQEDDSSMEIASANEESASQ